MQRPGVAAALPAFDYWVLRTRSTWNTSLMAMFVQPLLFLTALGIGLGTLVDDASGGVRGVEYLAFLAPGLLAVTAMQLAFDESAWPVVGALRWWRGYLAMQVTPLRTRDLLAGHMLYVAAKVSVAVVIFALVAVAFGAFDSPWALAAVPAAVLCGMAHATPVAAFAITRRSEISLAAFYRFVVLPVSLFSGAFFPVEQLPLVLEVAAYLTPLWHGVDLCRDLALGEPTLASALGHVGYLTVWLLLGFVAALRSYSKRLER